MHTSFWRATLYVRPPSVSSLRFFFQAADGIRAATVTGVQTCALPILGPTARSANGEDAVADAAFGMQLRESRKAAALSLRQLAVRVGYDHSYLSQVERGQRPGSADLARLCDRELGTGNHLASTYEQVQGRAVPAAQRAGSVRTTAQIDSTARPTDTHPKGVAALQPIDAAWHGLVGDFGDMEGVDGWDALLAGHDDWRSVP